MGSSQDTVPLQWSGAPLAKRENGKKDHLTSNVCIALSQPLSSQGPYGIPQEHHLQ